MQLNTLFLALWLASQTTAQNVVRKPLPSEPAPATKPAFIIPKIALPEQDAIQAKPIAKPALKPKPKTPTKKLTTSEQIAKLKKAIKKLETDIHNTELKLDRARAIHNIR